MLKFLAWMNSIISILDKNCINFIVFYYSFLSPTFLSLSLSLSLSLLFLISLITHGLSSSHFHPIFPSLSLSLSFFLFYSHLASSSSSLTHTFSLTKPAISPHHTFMMPRCQISLLIGK